ncbi:DUF1538 domain-containing protein [Chitinispirillales bacterium ANBcel5]|uniref:DUF1538 domain-containing protein n=1 Tax=Cellulosispirillum alkaliphilum TaxID=3039283 RepID=UPI002A577A48|nr:DUF1538 domain-containing protein [Chitinispirillales bacterium ANBcel5]
MDDSKGEEKIRVSFSQGLNLLIPYVRKRLAQQLRSVVFITLYLTFFQTLVLRVAIADAAVIATGMALVIVGLMFFMEGLFLGIMPLGEMIGLKLPRKARLPLILLFSFILGIGATLAEPAIGILRAAGATVLPWEAPLLYYILNHHPDYLVYAIGSGVGLGVLFGMVRFLYSWSLKPFVTVLTIVIGGLTVWATFNPNLMYLAGLAWDSGGVTTGPVTVPLVLALGIGVCRIVGGTGLGTSGFGVVTLASLFPVLTVQLIGIPFLGTVPQPMTEEEFVSSENRSSVISLFNSEKHFYEFITEQGLVAYDSEHAIAGSELKSLEVITATNDDPHTVQNEPRAQETVRDVVLNNLLLAMRAIIPLTLFLLLVLKLFLRERILKSDVIFTGVFFALIGMLFFSIGMEYGLSRLGNQVGRVLPVTFRAIPIEEEQLKVENFDTTLISDAITPAGYKAPFFYLKDGTQIQKVEYSRAQHDTVANVYDYVPVRGPLTGHGGELAGFIIILLFAIIMGYGATFAEPALNALGITVEQLTVGTFKRIHLMNAVASGVGIGLAFGMARIIWDLPVVVMLLPPYLVVLFLTWISSEDYVSIAWDSAGVTTGPITVPLVLAMGLGIGGQLGVVEGFGMLALASVWPILIVLSVGVVVSIRRKALARSMQKEESV